MSNSKPFVTIQGNDDGAPCWLLQFDGGAVPNPGACGSGAVLFNPNGICVIEAGEFCAQGTNNTAEWRGLELGLELAIKEGITRLRIEGDSNLVIKQMSGEWAVNSPGLVAVAGRVKELVKRFEFCACRHVYRCNNTRADAITNELQLAKKNFVRRLEPLKLEPMAHSPIAQTRVHASEEELRSALRKIRDILNSLNL